MKNLNIIINCELLEEYRYVQFYKKNQKESQYLFRKRLSKGGKIETSVEICEDESLVLTLEPHVNRELKSFCINNIIGVFFGILPKIYRHFCFISTCYQSSLKTEITSNGNATINLKYMPGLDLRKPIEYIVATDVCTEKKVQLFSENINFKEDYKLFNLGLILSFLLELITCGGLWIMNKFDWLERFSLFFWILLLVSVVYFLKIIITSNKEYRLLKRYNGDLLFFLFYEHDKKQETML